MALFKKKPSFEELIDYLKTQATDEEKAKVQDLFKAEDEREIDKIEETKADDEEVKDEKAEEVAEESEEIGKDVDEIKEEVAEPA